MAHQRGFNDRDFEEHYRRRYSAIGRSYQVYLPGYRHGWELDHEGGDRHREWTDIEGEARCRRDAAHPRLTWDDMRDAAREADDRAHSGGGSAGGTHTPRRHSMGSAPTTNDHLPGEEHHRDQHNADTESGSRGRGEF